ncbi:hypothetical protein SCHPADRAFT_1001762 [Schizopora paradoxa]|uniref:DUF6533 domain-containing protein n=1 Tax=Schizopora paradoxa TaxID=27342 RepID=A0A0H2RCT5_9AGAM|nr:hypothetical protein SCHPADRAFT_1001762 [Schizopora paradoxa]
MAVDRRMDAGQFDDKHPSQCGTQVSGASSNVPSLRRKSHILPSSSPFCLGFRNVHRRLVQSMHHIHSIERYLHDQRRYTYIQTAALSWVAYDIALTFKDEVSYVWRRKWSLPKVLYLTARYFGLVALISHVAVTTYRDSLPVNFCRKWLQFYTVGPFVVAFSVDALFVIRIYVLYGRSKWMLSLLLLLLVGQLAITVTTTMFSLKTVHLYAKPPSLPFLGCYGTKKSDMDLTLSSWIFILTAQAIFFALIIYKFVQSIRDGSRHSGTSRSLLAIARESHDFSPLLSLFLRDGTANLAIIFSSMVLNMVFIFLFHGVNKQFAMPWIIATKVVMGSRLYLNLKGFICGVAMPSFSAMERHIDLPSGATMTLISRNRLRLSWHNQQTHFAFCGSGDGTTRNSIAGRERHDETFTRILGCNRYEDDEKPAYHPAEKARIPSLIFEPTEFEGFTPEVISLAELESASKSPSADHVADEDYSEVKSSSCVALHAPTQTHLLVASPTFPVHQKRSINSLQTQRPGFSSASSDFLING